MWDRSPSWCGGNRGRFPRASRQAQDAPPAGAGLAYRGPASQPAALGAEARPGDADTIGAGVRAAGPRQRGSRAATALACWRVSQGRGREALDLLQPVYGWFTESLDTRDLKQAKALLDTLAAGETATAGTGR